VKQALPAGGPSAAVAPPRRARQLLTILAVVLVAFFLRACFFHDNTFEKIARDVTVALQHDDVATVMKYQNAETATEVNRERVGRAADALSPLGTFKNVKQTTVNNDTRVHDFDLTFEHGRVHETIKFDPEGKIVRFHYDPPTRS
jgi:hypothetical protein